MRATPFAAIMLVVAGALLSASTHAGGRAVPRFPCPSRYVCDAALGVVIRPPAGWIALPAGSEGPCTLAFARRPPSHRAPDYHERLIIKLVEVANTADDRALVQEYVRTLVRSYPGKGIIMIRATYGGAPAIIIRGLPPTPQPAVRVVVSYAAVVYLLTAPGTVLGADQRQALASLRFFIRQSTQCP